MAKRELLQLKVLSEKGVLYFGNCEAVLVPGVKEEVAVMPHHTPLVMKLGKGKIRVVEKSKKNLVTAVNTGIMYVGENEVSILVDV